ncbi:hypothetical protein [uncultured Henriciella sp.]
MAATAAGNSAAQREVVINVGTCWCIGLALQALLDLLEHLEAD